MTYVIAYYMFFIIEWVYVRCQWKLLCSALDTQCPARSMWRINEQTEVLAGDKNCVHLKVFQYALFIMDKIMEGLKY